MRRITAQLALGFFLFVLGGASLIGCGDNHPRLAGLVAGKLDETERRIAELQSLRQTLRGVLDRLDRNRGVHRCEESLCTCGVPLTIGPKPR